MSKNSSELMRVDRELQKLIYLINCERVMNGLKALSKPELTRRFAFKCREDRGLFYEFVKNR